MRERLSVPDEVSPAPRDFVAQSWAAGTEGAGLQQADWMFFFSPGPQMAVFLFVGCFDFVCPC